MVQALSKNKKKLVYTNYTNFPENQSDVAASNPFLRKAKSDAEDLMDIPGL